MRTRVAALLFLLAGCQAATPPGLQPRTPEELLRQWVLVERPYDEVEPWIRNAGDADLAGGWTTLVFEPVQAEGEERFGLMLQASRCLHRLRLSGDIPDRRQVGEPVEVALSIDCDPWTLHRVDVVPTRSGVRILGFQGTLGELPNLSGFYVRGAGRVALRFTADSQGLGGIKAILSEVGREGAPRSLTK